MTEHSNIAKALAAAQAEMGKALKQSNNPHFRSKYADLGNVMDACIPALNKNGIAVVQPFVIGEYGNAVKTVLLHESGESLECCVPLLLGKNDMQGLGSAVTYARRYGLMAMAGIAPEDDDGNAAVASGPAPNVRQEPKFDAVAAANRVKDKIRKAANMDDLKAAYLAEREVIEEIRQADAALGAQIVNLKDKRKAELEAAPVEIDDEIPH